MVDAADLKSAGHGDHAGSNPASGTTKRWRTRSQPKRTQDDVPRGMSTQELKTWRTLKSAQSGALNLARLADTEIGVQRLRKIAKQRDLSHEIVRAITSVIKECEEASRTVGTLEGAIDRGDMEAA